MIESNFTQDISTLKNLPKSWTVCDFADIFADISGGNKKLLKSDFLVEGKIAVVDQGKKLIAGYINEEKATVKGIPPYIVFGDHTRILKFVDFPFAMGADGTKVLKAKNKTLTNDKYLFHFLKSLSIPDTGYNRHFKYLKSTKIPLPPLSQQQKIAAILDAADALRQNDKALIAKYDELTQALFLDMFGDPVSNPKGWEKKLVEELCLNIVDCVNKTAPTVDFVTEYKMIRTPNVRNHSVNLESTRFVTLDTFRIWNRRLKPQRNDIVFTREAPVGEAGIILSDDQLMLGQRTMIYRVDESKVNNTYLLFQLMGSDVQRQISNISMGSTVKHLSVPSCKAFKILVPPIALQNQFAERVTIIEQQKAIAKASLERSEELFNSLLQKAFKGELV